MKDFFDIWLLASHSHFSGPVLKSAVQETFRQRNTTVTDHPTVFTSTFTQNPEKQVMWVAFLRRYHLEQDIVIPFTLSAVINHIAAFLQPVLTAIVEGRVFDQDWHPGGPGVD
jgi:hypothetical protein